MNRFDYVFNIILLLEGGYSNNRFDKGGETKYGISKRAYPNLDIVNLTTDQAKNIYYNDYWSPNKCDQLPQPLDLLFFDACVNQGQKTAILILQDALNISQDGKVGAKTIAAAHNSDKYAIVKEFLVLRALRYIKLDSFGQFGKGWLNRLFTLYDKALL